MTDSVHEYALARACGSELLDELRESAEANLRSRLRAAFEGAAVRAAFEGDGDPAPRVREAVAGMRPAGAEDLFDSVVSELVDEVARLKKHPPSLWLVDGQGKLAVPFREGMMYRPPDYVDELGVTRPARPVLHPAVAAPLTELMHERAKEARLDGAAFEHLRDPSSVSRLASERLVRAGFTPGRPDEERGDWLEVEVGREGRHVEQSPNQRAHRAGTAAGVLASRVAAAMEGRGAKKFWIEEPTRGQNSRFQWLNVRFRVC